MATSLTPATFRVRARGVFDSVEDEEIQLTIDEACRYVSEENWGERFDDGVFYMTAHILTELALLESAAGDGGAAASGNAVPAGPVSSESILQWRVSYAVSEGGAFDDALATTTWGRQYLARCHRVFSNRLI